jgi:nitrogen fixation NifU-like protein
VGKGGLVHVGKIRTIRMCREVLTMSDDFDRAMAELQQQVIEQARIYYSAKVVEEFYHPKNLGPMEEPDARGRVLGPCGDTMEFYLRLDGGRIERAAFMTDGCGATVACGSMLTQMIEGVSLEEASAITAEALTAALDGLPEEHAHCAELAINTLQATINSRGLLRGD